MKAIKKHLAALCMVAGIFATTQSNAQLTLGGGLAYGSEIDEAGFNLRAGALLTPNVHLGADFNYFFPGNDGISDIDVYGLNANLSFRLNVGEVLYLYPLVGVNYTSIRGRVGDLESTQSEVGANVGGGAGINLGPISPFAEYKYVISDYEQSVLNIGILLHIGSTD